MFVSLNNQKIICFDIVSFIVYCSAIAYVPYRYTYIIDLFKPPQSSLLVTFKMDCLIIRLP